MAPGRAIVVLAAVFALAAGRALASEANNDDIVVRVDTRDSTVIIDVEVPMSVSPEEAWPTLIDYDHMSEFIPNLSESRILARDGNNLRIVQKGRTQKGPLSFSFENVRDVALVPPREIRTRLVKGSLRNAESLTRIERTETGLRLFNHGEYTLNPLLPIQAVTQTIAAETKENFGLMRAEVMRRHARVASTP